MRTALFWIALGMTLSFFPNPVRAGSFRKEPVLKDLDFPVCLAFTPDGRLFFNERNSGRIRIIESPTTSHPRLLPDPLLEFGPVSTFFERGLLGLTLDPDFIHTGFVYIFYSHRGSDPARDPYRNRVMRLTAKGNKGENPVAIFDSLPIGSQSESGKGNHNGGNLYVGPDGKLYVTLGDLATPSNAQRLKSLAGKILRMNKDGTAPKDNPFYDATGPSSPRSYIFARGLRNSFDFTFHPETGALFATENGPATNDELNLIKAGGNYGWDEEQISGRREKNGAIEPLWVYPKTIAPTGIVFYTGRKYPAEFYLNLFFVDWNEGRIRRAMLGGKERNRIERVDDRFYTHGKGLLDIVNGPDDNLYFSDAEGIYRFIYSDDEK